MGVLYLHKKTEVLMSMFTVSIIFFVVLTVGSFAVGMWLQNSEKGR